ncbi:MAG: AbrB/MazE/SpoVT family DNA-binding domain-containing protein [Verrucomicrobia bacterium]|nr:AbrB/MazE/SpoVT family DNA-binding domain-containing protein [Verrucomicrobiota bacterium]
MTTILSQKGQIVLPVPIRQELDLSPGDDFEVLIEEENTITLRRISRPANGGLVDLLFACPSPFKIPKRERDASRPLEL